MLMTNVSHSPAVGAKLSANTVDTSDTNSLLSRFGDRMSSAQVADALGYSHLYFQKKIGSSKHTHLDWVVALKPARVRIGSVNHYKTSAVAKLMIARGLL